MLQLCTSCAPNPHQPQLSPPLPESRLICDQFHNIRRNPSAYASPLNLAAIHVEMQNLALFLSSNYINSFREFTKVEIQQGPVLAVNEKWHAPPAGFLKANFDAAYHMETHDGAFGYVIRSEAGQVRAAGAGKLTHLPGALHAEAEAGIAAMEAAANLGANRIIVESDSSVLVAAINTGSYDLADMGILFKEARSLCALHFDLADVVFCRRTCNSVAHCLAQFGYQDIAPYSTWEDDVPDLVVGLVAGDIAEQHV